MIRRHLGLAIAAACLGCALAPTIAHAQADYPSRPIRLVIPFPPGGGTDFVSRTVGTKLGEMTGWTIVLENRPGAGGNLGAEITAKSPADGYTVLFTTNSMAVNVSLYPKLNYDPVKDFVPVALFATSPNLLLVHPTLPVGSVRELVALARKRPGQLSFGSSGTGTSPYLAMELFKSLAGIDMTHVPYKGMAPA